MDSKKSPKGRKRTSKSSVGQSAADEGAWDCSVCTFKNNAEAFKCSMCDVRKGTSTRKPRLNPDLVAAQQAQALTPPPPPFPVAANEQPNTSVSVPSPVPSSSKSEAAFEPPPAPEEDEPEPEPIVTPSPSPSASKVTKKASTSTSKKSEAKRAQNKARLKNVDRSSATYHSVTVDDFTVVITEFKPKVKKEKEKKEKISNGSNNGNGDKKDKIKHEIKEESGEGPSRNGTSEHASSPNKIKTESKPGDSGMADPNVKGGGSSNTNPSLNHENGVNSRMSMDTSRSS